MEKARARLLIVKQEIINEVEEKVEVESKLPHAKIYSSSTMRRELLDIAGD